MPVHATPSHHRRERISPLPSGSGYQPGGECPARVTYQSLHSTDCSGMLGRCVSARLPLRLDTRGSVQFGWWSTQSVIGLPDTESDTNGLDLRIGSEDGLPARLIERRCKVRSSNVETTVACTPGDGDCWHVEGDRLTGGSTKRPSYLRAKRPCRR
jgi:hypothetical protein